MNQYLLKATRLFFRFFSRIAPTLTIHVAARLFTTPFSKRPLSDMEKEVLSKATRFSIPYQSDSELIAYRWGESSAPIVLFVHGWTGTASSFVLFIEPLVSRGFQVVAYDGPAHGASPGKTANLIEWTDSVIAAIRKLNQVHCIIGHSLGAGAILVASSRGLNTDKIVMIAPLNNIISVTEDFATQLSIPNETIVGVRDRIAVKYQQQLATYGSNWNDIFHSKFKVPTLILHDQRDKEIPWENAKAIAEQWPWATFLTTQGLGHRRILINMEVINQVTEFVSA